MKSIILIALAAAVLTIDTVVHAAIGFGTCEEAGAAAYPSPDVNWTKLEGLWYEIARDFDPLDWKSCVRDNFTYNEKKLQLDYKSKYYFLFV